MACGVVELAWGAGCVGREDDVVPPAGAALWRLGWGAVWPPCKGRVAIVFCCPEVAGPGGKTGATSLFVGWLAQAASVRLRAK